MANNILTTIKLPLVDYDRCLGIKSLQQDYVRAKYCPIDVSSLIKIFERSQDSAQRNSTSSPRSVLMDQDTIDNYHESALLINKLKLIGLCIPMKCNSHEMSVILRSG